ncbi:MAG: DUF4249 domain-containing protein [Flavobacteriales bacterium]|nr:DUF4249 domain-containing protein [Flavobacteriales bacterium]
MTMQRNAQLFCTALGALAFTACTKEIDLDLDDKSNKVVIEASVNEGTGPHTVRLSRSVAFDTPNDFPAISNATVVLSDDQGNSEQLIETSPGMYSSSTLAGVQGRNYQLSTTVSGTTYTAQCRMPPAVPLDTVRIDSLFVFGTYEVDLPVLARPGRDREQLPVCGTR